MSLKAGDSLLGKYRIEEALGAGAFAEVYRATHIELQVPRALKVLRRNTPGLGSTDYGDYSDRFRLEAQLGAQIKDPRIVQAYDFEQDGEDLILVMEYAPGGSLATRIQQAQETRKPIAVPEAVKIAIDVAEGLAALHAKDTVHRDLKPSNILFDEQGHAKVADLGLAQIPHGPSLRSQLSKPAPHPGTQAYMSPEQEDSPKYLTPASDVYALGLVMFQMLTGRVYKSQKPGTRVRELRPDVPDWLDTLLVKMLSPKPEDRPWGGEETARWLREGMAHEAAKRKPAGAPQPKPVSEDPRQGPATPAAVPPGAGAGMKGATPGARPPTGGGARGTIPSWVYVAGLFAVLGVLWILFGSTPPDVPSSASDGTSSSRSSSSSSDLVVNDRATATMSAARLQASAEAAAATMLAMTQDATPTAKPTRTPPPPPTATVYPTSPPRTCGDPAGFIRDYFDAVWQTRNYDYTWSLLTPAFQATSDGGFAEYVDWWNSVKRVELGSIATLDEGAQDATVKVNITFVMKAGGSYTYDITYILVCDDYRETWMIDATP